MIDIGAEARTRIEEETRDLYRTHREYLWYDPAHFAVTLYSWPQVEPDLRESLTDKVRELVFDARPFTLYAFEYVVRISHLIKINLDFQQDRGYRALVTSLDDFFGASGKPYPSPLIPLARYKVPAKQQYSHLKNTLSKIKTSVEVPVSSLRMVHVTDFGHGVRQWETFAEIPLDGLP